jgi:hypothetical protein
MAYSWNVKGGLMPAQVVSSPVVEPSLEENAYEADLAKWMSDRRFPQRSNTNVSHALQYISSDQCTTRMILKDSCLDLRCVECGEFCRDYAWSTVTRTEEYSDPGRRLLYLFGPFCARSCRLLYVTKRWWVRPNQSLTQTTLLDLLGHGVHWDSQKDEVAPVDRPLVRYRTAWEEIEIYYQDVAQGVDPQELSNDFVARWRFRDCWRTQLPDEHTLYGTCDACLQPYSWARFPMITGKDDDTGIFRFHPTLEFCDPSCWKRFLLSNLEWDSATFMPLGALYCALELHLPRVLAAPPREVHIDWCPKGGLTTAQFRQAAYDYIVIEFMPAPFVGSKMRMGRDPCLHARDIVTKLAALWPLDEAAARNISEEVKSCGGSCPQLPVRSSPTFVKPLGGTNDEIMEAPQALSAFIQMHNFEQK